MTPLIIIIVLLALLAFYGMGVYNKLVRKRTMMEEGWSGIDVQLKKRYNLIPNLVETVKGYAKHEQETLNKVIAARNTALKAEGVAAQTKAENQLNSALANVFALSEAYPELKANTNFLQLQNELSAIEGDVEKSRRYYNATVRENNIMVESFPSNLIAGTFGFHLGEYFELEDNSQRELPKVQF
ncbi:MAG: LemA family protein [Bacteroidota bacterium]